MEVDCVKLEFVFGLVNRKEFSSKITCRETKILTFEISRHLKPLCTLLKPI